MLIDKVSPACLFIAVLFASLLPQITYEKKGYYHPLDREQQCRDEPISCSIENGSFGDQEEGMEGETGFYLDFKEKKCLPGYSAGNKGVDGTLEGCTAFKRDYYISKNLVPTKGPGTECSTCILKIDEFYPDGESGIDGYETVYVHSTYKIKCVKGLEENGKFCKNGGVNCTHCMEGFEFSDNGKGQLPENPKPGKLYDYFGEGIEGGPKEAFSRSRKEGVYCPEGGSTGFEPGKGSACKSGYRFKKNVESCEKGTIKGGKNCFDHPNYCITGASGSYFDVLRLKGLPGHKSCAEGNGPYAKNCNSGRFDLRAQRYYFSKMNDSLLRRKYESFFLKYPVIRHQSMFIETNLHFESETHCLEAGDLMYRDSKIESTVPNVYGECHLISTSSPEDLIADESFSVHIKDEEAKKIEEKKLKERIKRERAAGKVLIEKEQKLYGDANIDDDDSDDDDL